MMLKGSAIFFIAYLVVLFCSTTNALLARLTSEDIGQSYIVGGREAYIEQFPHQVAIESKDGRFLCGGSIISKKHVLTSCDCAKSKDIATVRAGSSTWGTGGTTRKISKIFTHEKCDRDEKGFTNDIAILTVDKDFVYGTNVQSIRLSRDQTEITANKLSNVTGYGMHGRSRESLKHLRVVEVPMVSRTFCNDVYKNEFGYNPILKDRICAGTDKGGLGPCIGDHGGPLVFNNLQVGIVSYSKGCVEPKVPAVYTKVAYFSKWIEEHTRL